MGMEKKPNQLPRSPTNRLKAVEKNELSQLGSFQEVGGQMLYKIPDLLLSVKHAEISPCGLTKKHIHKTFFFFLLKKPGWLSKKSNKQKIEEPLKRLLPYQREKPRWHPQYNIKHQKMQKQAWVLCYKL